MINPQEVLKKYYGYDNFRPGQDKIINHILNNEDCLGIMPTGAGKSVCYQVPAMILPGVTLVISPLISLMKDQVDALNEIGIPSAYINSTLSNSQYSQTVQNMLSNIYKIIYVAPERLDTDSFINILNQLNISMITIDEAHCVSQWGHDFRPSYREIANVILNLKKRPIISAFTATATQIVKEDIIKLLHLSNPFTLTTGFDRKNLHFAVETPENKKKFLIDFLDKNKKDSGIIYCSTRKTVDSLYENLLKMEYNVCKYHGGMTEKNRSKAQDDFTYDRATIMIATNAFGMGIDKSNIRFVVHYNMPKDLESYYQEAGRGGRDGADAKCILLFSRSDIVTNKFLIEQTSLENQKVEYDKLNDMIDYCNTDKCLRKYILEYFDEEPEFEHCDNCSNCLSDIETTDITIDAKKILSCIKRMNERFGSGLVTDVLKGSNSAKIKSFGFDKLSTYGIMSEYSKDTIKDLIYFLITEEYIINAGDKYPILTLSPTANEILFRDKKIFIKKKIEKIIPKETSSNNKVNNLNYDEKLFDILRELRKEIAEINNIPPFIVFGDISLKEMSTYYPITVEKMLQINGVGTNKLEKYGKIFIETIQTYVTENNIEVSSIPKDIEKPIAITPPATKKTEKIIKEPKEDTKIISYNLFKEGKTIDEIASIREMTRQTIENHLIKCYEIGLEIDLSNDINVDFENIIFEAIENLGFEKLKPLKEALPDNVSYFDIHYFIAKYKKEND